MSDVHLWQRGQMGRWVGCGGWWAGVISAGDTMKVTGQKDLIAPFLSLVVWDFFFCPRPSLASLFFKKHFLAIPLPPSPGAVVFDDLK